VKNKDVIKPLKGYFYGDPKERGKT
jgi:hypothetical protein